MKLDELRAIFKAPKSTELETPTSDEIDLEGVDEELENEREKRVEIDVDAFEKLQDFRIALESARKCERCGGPKKSTWNGADKSIVVIEPCEACSNAGEKAPT